MVVRVVRVVCAVWCDSGDSGDGQGPDGCLVRIEVAVEAAMEGAKVTDPPSLRLGNAVLGTGQDAQVLEQRSDTLLHHRNASALVRTEYWVPGCSAAVL